MSQRYFLTAESTYESLRQSLNTVLAYPNSLGKSVFQTALYAPRDTFRRVLLAVDTDLPGYSTIAAAIAPLLDSDAMEEIDEATYLAALATATGGGASFTTVVDTLTYANFLPSGGSLATALSGINTALDGKAPAPNYNADAPNLIADDALGLWDDAQPQLWIRAFDSEVYLASGYDAALRTAIGAAAQQHAHSAADVTFAATDRLLGRSSAGAGTGQEIVCTAAGRAILDDADAAAQRSTLGLATVASSGSYNDLLNRPTIKKFWWF